MESVKHIAIIMDGSGRWAEARGLTRAQGHRQGLNPVRKIVKYCGEIGIETLTLFAFSRENKNRPEKEVKWLLKLFLATLKLELRNLNEANIRLEIIGDMSFFDAKLQKAIKDGVQLLSNNTGLKLVIAANYSGKWDITQATKKIAELCVSGQLESSGIDESLVEKNLSLAGSPVDLLIRTSGEQRISNFLLWQLAYSEFYFADMFWPDFDENSLDAAIQYCEGRKRKFGT
jgi:undecaprenyl diphosphate synthase